MGATGSGSAKVTVPVKLALLALPSLSGFSSSAKVPLASCRTVTLSWAPAGGRSVEWMATSSLPRIASA